MKKLLLILFILPALLLGQKTELKFDTYLQYNVNSDFGDELSLLINSQNPDYALAKLSNSSTQSQYYYLFYKGNKKQVSLDLNDNLKDIDNEISISTLYTEKFSSQAISTTRYGYTLKEYSSTNYPDAKILVNDGSKINLANHLSINPDLFLLINIQGSIPKGLVFEYKNGNNSVITYNDAQSTNKNYKANISFSNNTTKTVTPIEKTEEKTNITTSQETVVTDSTPENASTYKNKEQTIKEFLAAENERDINKVMYYFSSSIKQYWELTKPTHNQIINTYQNTWKNLDYSNSKLTNYTEISNSIADVEIEFSFRGAGKTETKTKVTKVRFVFDENGDIVKTYNIKE